MGVGGLSGWLVAAGCCCFRLIGLRRVGCFGCLFGGYSIAMLGWFYLIVWAVCLLAFDCCFFRLRVV